LFCFQLIAAMITWLVMNDRHLQVKTSNNECYRVTPVYGFVEKLSKTELIVIRLEGPPKDDKFVVQWAEVPDEETDAQAPFKAGAQSGEVIMPVNAQ
uniref:MSP domain-containing protein n=1 Tax=Anisakis simplex TaxID=6269 RepID=A0A0M3J983_ANISI